MNTPSQPTKINPTKAPIDPAPERLSLTPPKLLLPTLACLLITAVLYFLNYQYYLAAHLPIQLRDIIAILATFLIPALSLFLLHRLLEVVILYRAFRPSHLLSILAIILSAAIFYTSDAVYFWGILYFLALIVFIASITFQKKHSLATNPAHFHSSLLCTASASLILGFINMVIVAIGAFSHSESALMIILLSVVIIATLPLQLFLAFLCLAKLTPAKSANLLSRFDLFLLIAACALAIISTTTYLVYFEQSLASQYSNQPCCHHTN